MTKPLVTIGLPVFNGEKYLRNALNDLLAQDCRDFELVICDNGSTDSTPQICSEYAANDSRIRIERGEQNLGAIKNFNKAFELCTGTYFMWAAHDDGWEPSYLRRCIEELEKHSTAVLCASDLQFINDRGEEIETEWEFEATIGFGVEERIHSLLKRWGWYAIYGVMRPEFLRKTRLTQNLVGPDVVLLTELALLGDFAKVPEKLFKYRYFENKTAADSLNAMDPSQGSKAVTQFNSDLARDIWATIETAELEAGTKKRVLAGLLRTISVENRKWRDAIVSENPFAIYKRAADQVPPISLRRHLYRLLTQRSGKGQTVFPPTAHAFNHNELISPAPLHPTMPVRWMAPIFNPSGYASEAINFILPLANRIDLAIQHQNNIYSEKFVTGLSDADRNSLFDMRDKFADTRGGIVISHQPANGFSMLPDGEYHIGRTMYETDRIPAAWVTKCNLMDEIWVPSEFNKRTFTASGVAEDKIVVIPGAVDAAEFDPAKHTALPLPNKASVNFLSVFEWSTRKGWDVLLAAYLQEFSAEDDVCLYLRTYLMSKPDGDPSAEIWKRIKEFAATLDLGSKPWPRIEILADQTPTADLPRLYKAVDCLVAPGRGEGWGRPHHEAMMMGVPVIATGWSGNTEFMTSDNSYLINYELEEAARLEPELWHYQGHKWARASVPHLRELMRHVQTNPAERSAKGNKARADMIAKFSREAVSEKIVARLTEIERKLATPSRTEVCASAILEPLRSEPNEALSVAWEGTFLDLGSLSHVNREFTAALIRDQALKLTRVSLTSEKSSVEKPPFALATQPPPDVDVTIRHSWPPNWTRPKHGAWIQIQPWEYGALPAEWVERLQAIDQVWTYSEYLRRVYIDSGVAPSKVKVVPLGIDRARFHPAATPLPLATRKKFKFLFVGGTISRKGPDVLIQSFLDAFTAADDVCLVVKDFGAKGAYAGQTCGEAIRDAAKKPGAPEILFIEDELTAEQMASLYRACDCLVHPYRGEGFALPVLEAMACGLPVIVTANGATDDFATDEFAYRIPSTREPIGWRVADLRLIREGWLLEPDSIALTHLMRHVVAHPSEAREKGARASEFVRQNWTWQRAARIANEYLHELAHDKKKAAEANAAKRSRKLENIPMADVGYIGSLQSAHEAFARKDFVSAWSETKSALSKRSFHPKAWLFLGEIAVACGDIVKARKAVETALDLASEWTEAKRTQKRLQNIKGAPKNVAELELPERPSRTRLSVCYIVKNEEKFLQQSLSSIKTIAHEIIVIDTGSIDRTIEIAQEFGAQVHTFNWRDDFATARNAALEHATGDWILFLDADEELAAEAIPQLHSDLAHRKAICYRVPLVDKGRESHGCSHVPRLFRNGPGFFYFGRVHEELFFSIEPSRREFALENRVSKGLIVHHGYSIEVAKTRNKSGRNLQFLELAIEDWPNQPNLLINYALELSRTGRADEAVQHAVWAVEAALGSVEVSPEFREFLLTRAAEILMAPRKFQDVINLFATPLAKAAPFTASQHFLVGIAFLEKKRFEEAAGHFVNCIKKRSQHSMIPAIEEIQKGGPNHCLALCLAQLKQPTEAEKTFRAALTEDPSSTPLRIDFAKFLHQERRAVEALELLCAGVEQSGSDKQFWFLGGQIALSQPEFTAFAKDWTSQAIALSGEDPLLCEQRAEALLLNCEVPEALTFWRKTNHRTSPKCAAALMLCEAIQSAPGTHPGFEEPALSHAFIEWYRKLIAVNAVEPIQKLHTKLPKLAAQVPTAVKLLREAINTAETETEPFASA
ncbi:MAG TPA: glycosyltransferase [Verrucomicrobiae bacterium]